MVETLGQPSQSERHVGIPASNSTEDGAAARNGRHSLSDMDPNGSYSIPAGYFDHSFAADHGRNASSSTTYVLTSQLGASTSDPDRSYGAYHEALSGLPEPSPSSQSALGLNSNAGQAKQKRAYGKSCAACKRRKRKCPGRDANGVSLCTYCVEAGIPCEYGVSRDAFRLERAESDAARVRDLVAKANATSDPVQRQQLLNEVLLAPAPAFKKRKPRNGSSAVPTLTSKNGSATAAESSGTRKRKKPSDAGLGSAIVRLDSYISQTQSASGKAEYDDIDLPDSSSESDAYDDDAVRSQIPFPKQALKTVDGHPSKSAHTAEQLEVASILVDAVGGRARYTNLPSLPTSNATSQNINEVLSWAMPLCLWEDPVTAAQERELNEYFLCWLNPMFQIVARAQLEDAQYYIKAGIDPTSHPFLLACLHAFVALYCPGYSQRARSFAVRAHLLLATELAKPSSPTCVQGLLLLAVHHYGTGDYSQCRQLTATAVGMFDNLMHADTGQEVPASDNNNTMNGYLSIDNAGSGSTDAYSISFTPKNRDYKHLYWSLFSWDRLSSLCLNRHPFLRRRDFGPPDGTDIKQLWKPVLPAVEGQFGLPMPLYPPVEARSASCFAEKCSALGFLDEILNRIYSYARSLDRPPAERLVIGIRDRMSAWQSKLGSGLLLDASKLPPQAPPPHISYFNLLIRSAWILLYRPFYNLQPANLPGARDVCERCANQIHAIATLFRATFGSLCQSYIFIYSVYWAAHVFMAIAAREGRREDLVGKLSLLREVLAEWAQQPIHQAAIAPLVQQVDNFLGWSPATALQALGPTHLTFDPFEGLFFTSNIL